MVGGRWLNNRNLVGGRWSVVVLVGGRFFTAIGRWSVVPLVGGGWCLVGGRW